MSDYSRLVDKIFVCQKMGNESENKFRGLLSQ